MYAHVIVCTVIVNMILSTAIVDFCRGTRRAGGLKSEIAPKARLVGEIGFVAVSPTLVEVNSSSYVCLVISTE